MQNDKALEKIEAILNELPAYRRCEVIDELKGTTSMKEILDDIESDFENALDDARYTFEKALRDYTK